MRLRVVSRVVFDKDEFSISIPSGAIKRVLFFKIVVAPATFQFLLVRLRAWPSVQCLGSRSGISIPSGAIKRSGAVLYDASLIISIPSGAIKSF